MGAQNDPTGEVRVEIWRLLAPATGTANVTVNLNTSTTGIVVGVTTFSGVDQTTPLGTFTSSSGSTGHPSKTIASAPGELVFNVIAIKDGIGATAGGGQTQLWSQSQTGELTGGGAYDEGTASNSLPWISNDLGKEWGLGGITIKPCGPSVHILSSTEDAQLYQASPTSNYGDFQNFQVGDYSAGGTQELRTAIKFDATSFSGQTISSAVLKIAVRSSSNPPITLQVHRLTTNWSEANMTWNSPWATAGGNYDAVIAGSAVMTSTISLGDPLQIMSFDITNLVQQWANSTHPNYGIILIDPSGAARSLSAYTSESIDAPKLEVTY
ncbi:MAG: DNRLRE domain-containing protein [Saprospiraceae bacterium]|nr:DNRLRE domain-containing protein [Saprospiraceae bacterium]